MWSWWLFAFQVKLYSNISVSYLCHKFGEDLTQRRFIFALLNSICSSSSWFADWRIHTHTHTHTSTCAFCLQNGFYFPIVLIFKVNFDYMLLLEEMIRLQTYMKGKQRKGCHYKPKERLQKKLNLLIPCSWTSSHWGNKKKYFCCWAHVVCGALLWHS